MHIILCPKESDINDYPPIISGNIINYRGGDYDLSPLPEGGEVEAELPFVGPIRRVNGVVCIKLEYRYSTLTAISMQSVDWADYTFDIDDGKCPDPIQRKETPND